MEYISASQRNLTFLLFHGDKDDYKAEFILPLEDILRKKIIQQIFLDFSKLSFISQRQAASIVDLVQTLRLLNLPFLFKNMRPSVSLAFAQSMPDLHQQIRAKKDGNFSGKS